MCLLQMPPCGASTGPQWSSAASTKACLEAPRNPGNKAAKLPSRFHCWARNTPELFHAAMEAAEDFLKTKGDKPPMTFELESNPRFPVTTWQVMWGNTSGSRNTPYFSMPEAENCWQRTRRAGLSPHGTSVPLLIRGSIPVRPRRPPSSPALLGPLHIDKRDQRILLWRRLRRPGALGHLGVSRLCTKVSICRCISPIFSRMFRMISTPARFTPSSRVSLRITSRRSKSRPCRAAYCLRCARAPANLPAHTAAASCGCNWYCSATAEIMKYAEFFLISP